MRNALKGRSGAAIGVVALIVALSGSAIALPGRNTVNSGDIQDGTVKSKDMKIAYLYVQPDEDVVQTKNVVGTDKPIGNVLCVNLRFKPKVGNAVRSIESGGDEPFTTAHVAIPPLVGQSGFCDAPFTDAIVQVPGSTGVGGTYANFLR